MTRRQFAAALAASATLPASAQSRRTPTRGPLRQSERNPRYFADSTGKPIFLAGTHTWHNIQDSGLPPVPAFDWNAFLRLLISHNHNFTRLWTWEQSALAPWTAERILFQPSIYQRTGPGLAQDGGLKFDLTKFNPAYFDRLRQRTDECRLNGIYAMVMLFQGFSVKRRRHCGDPWPAHPLNKANNINGLDGDRDGDHAYDLALPDVRRANEDYMRKVVDTVGKFDNVMYEVINEGGNQDWDWWVVDTMHRIGKEQGLNCLTGLTGAGNETEEQMMASPADFIASGGRGGINKVDPPAWPGKKVNILDTDHIWGHGGTAAWVWKSLCRGYNTLLMDAWDPIAGKPCPTVNWAGGAGYPGREVNTRDHFIWEPVRQAMGAARRFAERFDLAAAVPSDEVSSTRFCLAEPGVKYLAYLPEGDEVFLDLSAAKKALKVEWNDPLGTRTVSGGDVEPATRVRLFVPFPGPAIVFLS